MLTEDELLQSIAADLPPNSAEREIIEAARQKLQHREQILAQARILIESEDSQGCTDDLTVVSSTAVANLKKLTGSKV
jgi:hypothetical protein